MGLAGAINVQFINVSSLYLALSLAAGRAANFTWLSDIGGLEAFSYSQFGMILFACVTYAAQADSASPVMCNVLNSELHKKYESRIDSFALPRPILHAEVKRLATSVESDVIRLGNQSVTFVK